MSLESAHQSPKVGDLVCILNEGAILSKVYLVVKIGASGFFYLYGKEVPYMGHELKVVSHRTKQV